MPVATKRTSRSAGGLSMTEMVELVSTVKTKLEVMESMSVERTKTVDGIARKQEEQDAKINQLVLDMAVLKTQHASFWKGVTVLFAVLSLIGGAIGWVAAQLVSFIHGHP